MSNIIYSNLYATEGPPRKGNYARISRDANCTKDTEAVDMNGRFQIQGGKNWDFAEIYQCKPVLLGLSLAGNLVKPLLSLYGTEWRERGYRLRKQQRFQKS